MNYITTKYLVTCICVFCTSVLAGLGGIGGGSMAVPIISWILDYNHLLSASLSICAGLGCVFAQSIFNLNTRNPSDERSSIILWDFLAVYGKIRFVY